MSPTLRALTTVTAVGSAAVGGLFLAFSALVMPALNRLPPAQAITTMQAINLVAVRPALLVPLLGTAAGCVAIGGHAVLHWGDRQALLLLAGSAAYLTGAVLVTSVWNVPLNDTLALADPGGPAAEQWAAYAPRWTAANHLRAASAIAAAAALVRALNH